MIQKISTKVVGITFNNRAKDGGKSRQLIVERMLLKGGAFVELQREYDNGHDANAVSVWMDNEKVGYINSDLAVDLAHLIDEEHEVQITDCETTGGTDENQNYGVHLIIEIER